MARIIKFPLNDSSKFGYKRVKKRKRVDPEDLGQLNIFDQANEAKVIEMRSHQNEFEFALSLDEQGDKRAKDFYWRAIEASQSTADAYCNLGILESEERNFAKAIDCFTNCLKHDPRHYEAHYNLANVYSEAGNRALAKIHYELAVEIEPEFASAYYNLGLVLALENDFKSAVDVLKKYKLLIDDDHDHIDRLIDSLRKTITSRAQ